MMTRKLGRWLRSKTGKWTLAGLVVVFLVVVSVGQVQGWWAGLIRYLSGSTFAQPEVRMTSFTASVVGDQVVLNWSTEIEKYNVGFDLYRTDQPDGGPFVHLNPGLIPSQVTEGSPSSGASYMFMDTSVVTNTTYYYWIESVDPGGFRTRRGDVTVAVPEVFPVPTIPVRDYLVFLPLVLR